MLFGAGMEWQWLKEWWRLKRWRSKKKEVDGEEVCYCDDCLPDVRCFIPNVVTYPCPLYYALLLRAPFEELILYLCSTFRTGYSSSVIYLRKKIADLNNWLFRNMQAR